MDTLDNYILVYPEDICIVQDIINGLMKVFKYSLYGQ